MTDSMDPTLNPTMTLAPSPSPSPRPSSSETAATATTSTAQTLPAAPGRIGQAGTATPQRRMTAMARFNVHSRPTFARQVAAILRKSLLCRLRDPLPVIVNIAYAGLVLLMLWLMSVDLHSGMQGGRRNLLKGNSTRTSIDTLPKLADPADTCINVPRGQCVHIGVSMSNSTGGASINPVLSQLELLARQAEHPHPVIIRQFASQQDLLTHYDTLPRSLVSAVHFEDIQAVTTLPFNLTTDPNTIQLPTEQASVSYHIYGNATARIVSPIAGRVLTLQAYVERALINARRGQFALAPLPLTTRQQQSDSSTSLSSTSSLLTLIYMQVGRSAVFGIFAGLFFIYLAIDLWNSVFSDVASDKQHGIREALTVQGLSPVAYCVALFIAHVLFTSPIVVLFAITLTHSSLPTLFPLTDPTVVATILVLYFCTLVTFGLLLSTCVSDPVNGRYLSTMTAVGCAVLVLFVAMRDWDTTYSPEAAAQRFSTWKEPLMYLFLSPITLVRMCQVLNHYESIGVGTSWAALVAGKAPHVLVLMACLVANWVVVGVLVWYVDQVVSGGMPVGFALRIEYWFPSMGGGGRSDADHDLDSEYHQELARVLMGATGGPASPTVTLPAYALATSTSLASASAPASPAISMRNLVKAFSTLNRTGTRNIDRVFVKNMTLDIPRGSVVGLVGRNGEGKTTTMRMICGLARPTLGDICVLGTRLSPLSLRRIQSKIGLCPQSNVLWPQLTCLEHVQIMAEIRGVQVKDKDQGSMREYLMHLLHDVYLGKRAHAKAGTLSGGQKRKLCMAMAMVGSPPVLLLDEPTCSMDVYTRQHAWSLIQQARQHSTIVLTSHSMHEIETVCDYVAIIKTGQVRVVGSPLEIKSKYAAGYRIVVERFGGADGQAQDTAVSPAKVLKLVRDFFLSPSPSPSLSASASTSDAVRIELVAVHPTNVIVQVAAGADADVGAEGGNGDWLHTQVAVFMAQWDALCLEQGLGTVLGVSLSVVPLEDVFVSLNDDWSGEGGAEEEEHEFDKYEMKKRLVAVKSGRRKVGRK